MKNLMLIVSAFGLLSACAGSEDHGTSSGGNSIKEQKLTTATWCTNSLETMDSDFVRGVTYQFYHRMMFSSDGLITWQKFSLDHNSKIQQVRKTTCRQNSQSLNCDAVGFENLKYELGADGSELNLLNTGKDGKTRRVIEKGGTLRKCTEADGKRFGALEWN